MKLLAVLLVSACVIISASTFSNKEYASPEISLPNPSGELINLSSLQGDLVLIDFWASWCKPCRAKHPELSAVYNKFKDASFKNADSFQIYSVSLDKNKAPWVKAISQDKLDWPNHVSDLKGWKSAAAVTYGINSIPSNILIDKNGEIIGKNYSAEELSKKLESLR